MESDLLRETSSSPSGNLLDSSVAPCSFKENSNDPLASSLSPEATSVISPSSSAHSTVSSVKVSVSDRESSKEFQIRMLETKLEFSQKQVEEKERQLEHYKQLVKTLRDVLSEVTKGNQSTKGRPPPGFETPKNSIKGRKIQSFHDTAWNHKENREVSLPTSASYSALSSLASMGSDQDEIQEIPFYGGLEAEEEPWPSSSTRASLYDSMSSPIEHSLYSEDRRSNTIWRRDLERMENSIEDTSVSLRRSASHSSINSLSRTNSQAFRSLPLASVPHSLGKSGEDYLHAKNIHGNDNRIFNINSNHNTSNNSSSLASGAVNYPSSVDSSNSSGNGNGNGSNSSDLTITTDDNPYRSFRSPLTPSNARFSNAFQHSIPPASTTQQLTSFSSASSSSTKENIYPYPLHFSAPHGLRMPSSFSSIQNDSSSVTSTSDKLGSMKKSRSMPSVMNVLEENRLDLKFPELDQLAGQIYALSKYQQGCRYLQKKLEENNPANTKLLLDELSSHLIELMTDPFGNYLFSKLLEHCNGEQKEFVLGTVLKDLLTVAFDMYGSQSLQKMVPFLNETQIGQMISILQPSAIALIKHSKANYLIQYCLDHLSQENNHWIYTAVVSNMEATARDRVGCVIVKRCIDRANAEQMLLLSDAISKKAISLVQDPFGNYVVQHVLDKHPKAESSQCIISKLIGHLAELCVQKFSSNVIEKCLKVANSENRQAFLNEIIESDMLAVLLNDRYANFVIQTALDIAEPEQRQRLIKNITPLLSKNYSPYTKRLQKRIFQGWAGSSSPFVDK